MRKWLKTAVLEEPKYRRSEAPGKLTAHHETLKLALKADAHRPRHERRTARALYEQIRRDGYAGCYSRVTDFVRAWRQGEGQSISTKAFVPLAFELGELKQLRMHGMAGAWADLFEQGGGGGAAIESSRWLLGHRVLATGRPGHHRFDAKHHLCHALQLRRCHKDGKRCKKERAAPPNHR